MPDPIPPIAARHPVTTERFGETFVDDYAWMRQKDDPAVIAALHAENAYAEAVLAPLKPLAARLYDEMLARIKEDDVSVPYRKGDWIYYHRLTKGSQYVTYCRKQAGDAPEHVILDVNELALDKPFMAIGAMAVSDNGRYLAYSTDETGFREYTLHVKDLETDELLPLRVERTVSVAWTADNRTLFFTLEDEAKRPNRLFRIAIDADPPGELVYEEPDELFRVSAWRSRSERFIFLNIASHTTSEYHFLEARDPLGEFQLISTRRQDHEYDVEHSGDYFYIRTNDAGRNFRIIRTPLDSPAESSWTEVLPHSDTLMLDELDAFAGHLVVTGRENALPCFDIQDLATAAWTRVTFPEAAFEAAPENNRVFDTTLFRYRYESPVTPPSVFDYDIPSGQHTLLKQQEVPGGYDPANYTVERFFVPAADGVEVPVTVTRRKDTPIDGTTPMHLQGYGAYGFSYPVSFNSNRVSLLDRGGIHAIAHIRGGGELGKKWHDAGRMQNKHNTFTDFIAVADTLVERGYCDRDRLVIEGRSAGGLLMGAVLNLRPNLARAAILGVPFVDVINTMSDASLPLTVGEWEEWGSPLVEQQYRWIRQYCPYSNLGDRPYPTLLIRTAFNDSQVMYWEPAKYVARLRTLETGNRPVLFLTNMDAGHGGSSGRYDYLHEVALDYAFMFWQQGLASTNTGSK